MVRTSLAAISLAVVGLAKAQCPYADPGRLAARAQGLSDSSRAHLRNFEVDDSEGYLTSDVGGPIEDQNSLKAGERGPTLLEDFIFRQKITHFDHERVGFCQVEGLAGKNTIVFEKKKNKREKRGT